MYQKEDALAQFIAAQQRASDLARPTTGELHLHQHHHAAPSPAAETERPPERLHPLFVATYMLFVSLAISVPLALIGAIVEATNQPDVQYIQPGGRW